MPWKESSPVTERERFVDEYMRKEHSVAELCRRFGISRKTAYKWIDRYLSGCELGDRSRRPKSNPRAVAQWLEDAIVHARKKRPGWGPKKLRAVLARDNPTVALPSVSTFALIFDRNGLVVPRRKRRRTPPSSTPFGSVAAPNDLWCVDFKGHFPVGQTRCHPLTVMDAHSRYLIAVIGLKKPRIVPVRRAFEQVFAEFGLPAAIRSDNGVPFACKGLAGLTQLSAWWLKLGIRHERIEPGRPDQNGRHERMHLTLKQATAMPPCGTMRKQQRSFDLFRKEYNDQRPHEALGMQVPAQHYERSQRALPDPPWAKDLVYPEGFETVRISRLGNLRWNGRTVHLSSALKHELVGLEWDERGAWAVYFGRLRLGVLNGLSRRTKLRFTEERVSPMSLE